MNETNSADISVVSSQDDFRLADKDDVQFNPLKKYDKQPRVSSNGQIFQDENRNKPDRLAKLERKLQKEIQVAQKVLDEKHDVHEMFSDDEDFQETKNKSRRPPVTYNAANEILKKYGNNDNSKNSDDKKLEQPNEKGKPGRKKVSDDDYGVPAAEMIIKKYPPKEKKKKPPANTKADPANDKTGKIATKKSEGKNDGTAAISSEKQHSDDVPDVPGSTKSKDEIPSQRMKPHRPTSSISNRPTSAVTSEGVTAPNTQYQSDSADPPPEDPRHNEVVYDGFDSDEEAKLKGKSKVQKLSNDIFGGKYENHRISTAKSKNNATKNTKPVGPNGSNATHFARPTSSSLAKSENRPHSNSAESQRSRTPNSRPETASLSANRAKTASSSKYPKASEQHSSSKGTSSEPKSDETDEPKLPSPVQNKHYSLLMYPGNEPDSDESENDEPEQVLTKYLQQRKDQKEAVKSKQKK